MSKRKLHKETRGHRRVHKEKKQLGVKSPNSQKQKPKFGKKHKQGWTSPSKEAHKNKSIAHGRAASEDPGHIQGADEGSRNQNVHLHRHGYSTEQRILLVGEGNFSFTLALLQLLGSGENLFATAYDSRETVLTKYQESVDILKALENAGMALLFNIDATRLQQSLHVGKKRRRAGAQSILDRPFDRIIFNFPHAGLGIKDQNVNVAKNRDLLAAFFASAAPLLAPGGEIHVTTKTGGPYDKWNVPALAKLAAPLALKTALVFRPANFPGYVHRRTLGWREGISAEGNEEIEGKARTYVFVAR